jgi:TolB-like protein
MIKKKILCVGGLLVIALTFVSGGLDAQQPVVAVAPFDAISGISSMVDRSVVERVLREHSFQAGDWANQQKTAELGTVLNADWIVRGEMEKFGSNILVTVQFYDIRTFRFMGGADLRLANVDEV